VEYFWLCNITEHIRLLPDISGMCFFLSIVFWEQESFDRHTEAWHRSLSYGPPRNKICIESVMGSVCWRSVPTRHVPHRSAISKKEDFFGWKPTPN
jgi:hypothetical protein